jgi:hypothetical protein
VAKIFRIDGFTVNEKIMLAQQLLRSLASEQFRDYPPLHNWLVGVADKLEVRCCLSEED